MSKSIGRSLASIAVVAIGCGTARPSPPTSGTASASATPLAIASTAAPPQPPPARPEPTPEPPSPFQVVAEFEREPVLHGLGDQGFVSLEQELQAIDGDRLNADKSLVEGLPEPKGLWRIAHIAGKWPDAAWLEVVEAYGSTGRSIVFRRRGRRWQLERTIPGEKMFVGIAPWTADRLLGLVQSGFAFDATFRLVSEPRRVTLPQFTKPKRSYSFCTNRVHAEAFTALSSGHVFVGGMACEATSDDAAAVGAGIERWEPGQARGMVEMLPGMDVGPRYDAITVNSLVALSPTEVYAAVERVHNVDGSPRTAQLFRFDGAVWSTVPTGIPKGVANLWLGGESTLWAADSEGQLWKRAHDAGWVSQALPPALRGGRVGSIWQRADNDVWAVVHTRERSFVVHTAVAPK